MKKVCIFELYYPSESYLSIIDQLTQVNSIHNICVVGFPIPVNGKFPLQWIVSRRWRIGGAHMKITYFSIILSGKPYTFILRMSGMCQMHIYGDTLGQS